MNKKILELTPKRFLCPYCGEWHEWNEAHELGYYDISCEARFECSTLPYGSNKGDYRIYFYNGNLYYSTESVCNGVGQKMEGNIPISSIKEDSDKPIVTFKAELTSNRNVGTNQCCCCSCNEVCNFVKLGDEGDGRHMTITFGFEFEQSDYDKIARNGQMNQLFLFMLFKEKLGGDDDMMKMMLMASMAGGQNTGMDQLLPLMLFKDKLGGDDDMMKMMLMASMAGGQNTGMNQLLSSGEMEDDDDRLPF